MTELQPGVPGIDFKDRKTTLFVLGICQCIIGIFCAMAIPFMLLSIVMTKINPQIAAQANTSAIQIIPALLVYALASAWFVTMGIGSIKRRRWARALTLVSSWLWLVGGVIGLVFLVCLMPAIHSNMQAEIAKATPNGGPNQMPPGFMIIMTVMMIAMVLVMHVILPLILVLCYSGKNVKATCEHWDEKIRWTDKCPLPVLAVCVIFAIWLLSMPTFAFQNWAVPFFGNVIESYAGAAATLCIAGVIAWLTWRLYKLDTLAWWGSVIFVIAWFTSFILTFGGEKIWIFYEKFNLPAEQIDALKETPNFQLMMVAMFITWQVIMLGYLVFIKRYFKKDSLQDNF